MIEALPLPLIVSAEECERAVNVPELIEEIAQGFIAYTGGKVVVPPVGYLGFTEPTGDVHLKYGYVKGGEVFVIKVAAGFPQNAQQERFASAFMQRLNAAHIWKRPIATKIEHGGFYPAEAYHQGFAAKHPYFPYIAFNDRPKIVALKQKFPALYKG